MPKLKPVTDAEIDALIERLQDLQHDAADVVRRATNIFALEIKGPAGKASAAFAAIRSLHEFAALFALKAAYEEDDDTLEATLRARRDDDGAE